jgi:hypothetical protein
MRHAQDKVVREHTELDLLLPSRLQQPNSLASGCCIKFLDFFCENPLPYSGLVGDGKSFLESILFYR